MPYNLLTSVGATQVNAPTLGAPRTTGESSFLELRQGLAVMLGNRSEATATNLGRWVNQAYKHLGAMVLIPELEVGFSWSTVADAYLYELPAQVRVLTSLALGDPSDPRGGQPLQPIDIAGYYKLVEDSGVPARYVRMGRILALWPSPSSAYALYGTARVRPLNMVLDTDYPLVGDEWSRAITLKAKAMALADLRDIPGAMAAENDFARYVSSMSNPDALETSVGEAWFSVARSRNDLAEGA